MTERPEWMPSDEELERAIESQYTYPSIVNPDRALDELIYRVVTDRVLAVLNDLKSEVVGFEDRWSGVIERAVYEEVIDAKIAEVLAERDNEYKWTSVSYRLPTSDQPVIGKLVSGEEIEVYFHRVPAHNDDFWCDMQHNILSGEREVVHWRLIARGMEEERA